MRFLQRTWNFFSDKEDPLWAWRDTKALLVTACIAAAFMGIRSYAVGALSETWIMDFFSFTIIWGSQYVAGGDQMKRNYHGGRAHEQFWWPRNLIFALEQPIFFVLGIATASVVIQWTRPFCAITQIIILGQIVWAFSRQRTLRSHLYFMYFWCIVGILSALIVPGVWGREVLVEHKEVVRHAIYYWMLGTIFFEVAQLKRNRHCGSITGRDFSRKPSFMRLISLPVWLLFFSFGEVRDPWMSLLYLGRVVIATIFFLQVSMLWREHRGLCATSRTEREKVGV